MSLSGMKRQAKTGQITTELRREGVCGSGNGGVVILLATPELSSLCVVFGAERRAKAVSSSVQADQ